MRTSDARTAPDAQSEGGWVTHLRARIREIGADPTDDDELRQKKALLVLLAILILPVSLIWGSCYLAFGSLVGVIPFIYFTVSVASLVVFSKTRSFGPFLTAQLLDIMLTTTAGQMFAGGFLAAGGVGLWGMLAPIGALVFLEVRTAINWFIGFLSAFILLASRVRSSSRPWTSLRGSPQRCSR